MAFTRWGARLNPWKIPKFLEMLTGSFQVNE